MHRLRFAATAIRASLCMSLGGVVTLLGACSGSSPPTNPTPEAVAAGSQGNAAASTPLASAPIPAAELYRLVAPIALFPDNLVAQVLAGATYPDQIDAADRFLALHPGLARDALRAQVDPQPWDASVKSLTTFPSVLDQMATNRQWTQALGDAYANEPTDVMNAIQVPRQRAQHNGSLHNTAQQVVRTQTRALAPAQEDQEPDTDNVAYEQLPPPAQTIEILPAQPDVVYVPSYDPQVVYGERVPLYSGYRYVEPSGYSTGDVVGIGAISFGAGILVGALLEHHHDDRYAPPGGGWHSWGVNWGDRGNNGDRQRPAVIHENNVYVTRSTTVIDRSVVNNRVDNRNVVNNTTINNRVVNNRDVTDQRIVDDRGGAKLSQSLLPPAPAALPRQQHPLISPPSQRPRGAHVVSANTPMTMPHFSRVLATTAPAARPRLASAPPHPATVPRTIALSHPAVSPHRVALSHPAAAPPVPEAEAPPRIARRSPAERNDRAREDHAISRRPEPSMPAPLPRPVNGARVDAGSRQDEPRAAPAPYRPPQVATHYQAPPQTGKATEHHPEPHAVKRDEHHGNQR